MKNRFLLMLWTVMLFSATLSAMPTVSKAVEKTPITDAWLTAKTKIFLAADTRVKARQIDVDTQNGTVSLRGKVDSDEAKKVAEEITKSIEGVKNVKNELQVVVPSERDIVEKKD